MICLMIIWTLMISNVGIRVLRHKTLLLQHIMVQICVYIMSNNLTLMDINFTLHHSGGQATSGASTNKGKAREREPPPAEQQASNMLVYHVQ